MGLLPLGIERFHNLLQTRDDTCREDLGSVVPQEEGEVALQVLGPIACREHEGQLVQQVGAPDDLALEVNVRVANLLVQGGEPRLQMHLADAP